MEQERTEKLTGFALPDEGEWKNGPSPLQRLVKPPYLNIFLFLLTCLSTFAVPTFLSGKNPFTDRDAAMEGLEFCITLMGILLFHEGGHYIMAKKHGIMVSLPFFIPVPFGIGTMGAIIKMRGAPRNRRALIDVGMAGPLSGALLSVIAVIIGLSFTDMTGPPIHEGESVIYLGSSILFDFLVKTVIGIDPSVQDLILNPVAFAGWIGLFVTSMNLIPVGQLDGGHIAFALFGKRVRIITVVSLVSLLFLSLFWWPGWGIWLAVMFLMRFRHPVLLDPETGIGRGRRILGLFTLLVLVITFIPNPISAG